MIVVVTERKLTAPGKFNPASLEALAAGQQLGRQLGLPVSAVVLEAADSGLAAELSVTRLRADSVPKSVLEPPAMISARSGRLGRGCPFEPKAVIVTSDWLA